MASDGVEILGLEQVVAKLHQMGPELVKVALRDCLDAAGSVLQTAQIEAAPVLEGEGPHPEGQLKEDIRRVVSLKPFEGTGTVAVGPSSHSFYGSFREFGTSHEAAQPWMRPAFDLSAPEALNIFGKVLAAHIEAYSKGIDPNSAALLDTSVGAAITENTE